MTASMIMAVLVAITLLCYTATMVLMAWCSDDRSAARLRQKVKAATEMKSVFTDRKPNLVVIDEIDGAMGSEQNVCAMESSAILYIHELSGFHSMSSS